jgi:hypothetical protein
MEALARQERDIARNLHERRDFLRKLRNERISWDLPGEAEKAESISPNTSSRVKMNQLDFFEFLFCIEHFV